MRSLYKAEAMEFSVHVCHSSQSLFSLSFPNYLTVMAHYHLMLVLD